MSRSSVQSILGPALLASALLVSGQGCAASEPGAREEAIVSGSIETGYNSVYYIVNYRGGACTAALISPRVVLTARHCVVDMSTDAPAAARFFRVYAGWSDRNFYAEYRVSEVHIIPGSTGDIGDGNATDLGILVLSSPAAETPIDMAREVAAGGLLGTDSIAIGFGQTPAGNSGTKYRGIAHVIGLDRGLIFVDPSVCSGDSGGPLIGADGRIYGVASFIYSPDGTSQPRCGTAPGAYNEIFQHIGWIESILESVGDECIADPEVCDGIDNDCNGVVDDPCIALGDVCMSNEECGTGLCDDVGGVRICTQECSPSQGSLGCGLGLYCAVSGCAGRCARGTPGTLTVGTSCVSDLDCASAFCRDPGDRRPRCLEPCERGLALCLAAEVCFPLGGSDCGGCVDAAIVGGAHALGEPCGSAAECSSGSCVVRGGVGECATACGAGDTCPEGFTCDAAMCVVDRRQPIGGPCGGNTDCQTGLCATLGEVRWCTAVCGSDAGCPGSFVCDPTAHVCAPEIGLDGEACASSAECVSGLCGMSGSAGVCVSLCGPEIRCGVGFECRRTSDGAAAVCTRPPSNAGGCAAGHARRRAGATSLAGVALLVVIALRRRGRR